jgi:hypothetical protein
MDASAITVWMAVLSTLSRDFELGTTMKIQHVHDLLNHSYGSRMWHGKLYICLFQG